MPNIAKKQRLRGLKHKALESVDGREGVLQTFQRMEADLGAEEVDLNITGVSGQLKITLGESGTVTELVDDVGSTYGLAVWQGTSGKHFVIWFSAAVTVDESGNDVEVSFS